MINRRRRFIRPNAFCHRKSLASIEAKSERHRDEEGKTEKIKEKEKVKM
jgi:hypothetical protein